MVQQAPSAPLWYGLRYLKQSSGLISTLINTAHPSCRAILTAVQAGVPVVSLQCPFSIADRSHMPSLEMAREYNIKVCMNSREQAGCFLYDGIHARKSANTRAFAWQIFARIGLVGGLISKKHVLLNDGIHALRTQAHMLLLGRSLHVMASWVAWSVRST